MSMKMLCGQSTRIFLKILKILQSHCKVALRTMQRKGEGDCSVPKADPFINMGYEMNCKYLL
jgi:hypothetical protein